MTAGQDSLVSLGTTALVSTIQNFPSFFTKVWSTFKILCSGCPEEMFSSTSPKGTAWAYSVPDTVLHLFYVVSSIYASLGAPHQRNCLKVWKTHHCPFIRMT